jgi:hypothetical protein
MRLVDVLLQMVVRKGNSLDIFFDQTSLTRGRRFDTDFCLVGWRRDRVRERERERQRERERERKRMKWKEGSREAESR